MSAQTKSQLVWFWWAHPSKKHLLLLKVSQLMSTGESSVQLELEK